MNNFSIVVPFYNGHEFLYRLIRGLPRKYPIVVVDDLSDEPLTQERIDNEWDPDENNIRVVRMAEKGYFAGAVNRGIRECRGDVLVLNQDVWFDSLDFLESIDSFRKEYAFFGERIRGLHPSFGELGYIHGTCMYIRRDAVERVGFLNEKIYPLWGNTAEYQWRVARAGFKVLPIPVITGMHHERKETEHFGKSIKNLLYENPEKRELFIRTPPLLSVVVPCYNYGHYLEDCINSLIGGPTSLGDMEGQTLQSFEVIVVDDASTDASPEYIKQISDISKGIRSFRLKENVGTAQALNFGIDKAMGKYITFLSADDMRESFSLEKLVETCEQNPHSFAYDDIWLTNRHQRVKKWKMEEYDFDGLIWKNQVHAGIVFPKAAWKDVGGYPAIMNDGREDWAFNVALGVKGWCGIHVHQFGYLYRREGQNRTEYNTTEDHRQQFLGKIQSLFPGIYRGERPVACCGKGSNKKTNNGVVNNYTAGGMMRMSSQLGATAPMVKLQYLGEQVSSTWTGDATGATYAFGKDRPRGWVDKRDVGDREKINEGGFLTKKDKYSGKWLFKVATEVDVVVEPVEVVEPMVSLEVIEQSEPEVVPQLAVAGNMQASLVSVSTMGSPLNPALKTLVETPNPDDLTIEQIKALSLNKAQWERLYSLEMSGRNRKGLTAYLEDKIANWQE